MNTKKAHSPSDYAYKPVDIEKLSNFVLDAANEAHKVNEKRRQHKFRWKKYDDGQLKKYDLYLGKYDFVAGVVVSKEGISWRWNIYSDDNVSKDNKWLTGCCENLNKAKKRAEEEFLKYLEAQRDKYQEILSFFSKTK